MQEVFVGEDDDVEEMLEREVQHAGMDPRRADAAPDAPSEEEAEEAVERPRRAENPQGGVAAEDRQKIRRLHVNLGRPSKEIFFLQEE